MKRIWYYVEAAFDLVSMTTFSYFANHLFGQFGIFPSILFILALNFIRFKRNRMSYANTVKLPGAFTVLPQAMMAISLNGRTVVLNKGEGIEVKVPTTCGAAMFNFIDKDKESDDNDDILNSSTIA